MNAENARSNYTEDRSRNFKHNVPSGIIPPSAPTVQDYVNNEKSKQMSKMRDWYLESKNSYGCEGKTDLVELRSNFSSSRSFTVATPIDEIDHHKAYLIGGAILATILGGLMFMVH
jgi:hypothetical protein